MSDIAASAGHRAPARASIRRVEAVVNAASGSVGPGAAADLERTLGEAGLEFHVADCQPSEIADALRRAVDARPDLLIVLAGDGTARLAGELCGRDGPLVAPLPGGTMNMLPHAVYGDVPWRRALEQTLAEGVERPISGGEVDGRPFYVAAILGAPALWAPAREALRAGKLKLAFLRARRALTRAFKGRLRFALDGGGEHKAEALTLMCPLVSRAMSEQDALEASALDPKGAGEAFRLGARTLLSDILGDWRKDPAVTVSKCRAARVRAHGRIPVILDGEPHRLDGDVQVRFVREAFRAFAPPAEPTQAGAHEKHKEEAGAAVAASAKAAGDAGAGR